ncbi:MAG TPA: NHL repeat-containing protein [Blastocatellia bacterium]|nr:NHL repeat-containing protein [Blastocatellia bacterium]
MAPSTLRRIFAAVLILILPSAVAIVVYFLSRQKLTPTRRDVVAQVTTIAGAGLPGAEEGPLRSARFANPFGILVDKHGEIIISDGGNNRIYTITAEQTIKTIAGASEGYADGAALQAAFNTPSGIATDKDGNIIIADTSNNRIRKLSNDRKFVTTIAGSGAAGNRDGAAAEAEFDGPIGVAVDRDGNIFVADAYNDRIRKISSEGSVTTIAGAGAPGFADGAAAQAMFDTPCGIAVDPQGNLFIADTGNHAVRKITPQGEVSTIIKGEQANGETQAPQIGLRQPIAIAITHDGFLFVTDEATGQVLRITPELEASVFAGSRPGFADGAGAQARLNGPVGLALDHNGNIFVADSRNYLIRMIASVQPSAEPQAQKESQVFIQPPAEPADSNPDSVIPHLDPAQLSNGQTFYWPLAPQDQPHEITGVVGEARGAPGGVALDHIHSGLDIRGNAGEQALSVMDEKVLSPIPTWGFNESSEGINVGLMSYIHIRVGRNAKDEIQAPDKFKAVTDGEGNLIRVRVRRGTRFKVGDFVGTLNNLYHVHLNFGPTNAEANPIQFPFIGLKDTVAPTIEPNGIEVVNQAGELFKQKRNGRLVITGDVDILVTAYDRIDGNGANRKLGLYRAGYQVLKEDGTAAAGFEQPLINIEFNRLPPDDESVRVVYADGSGVSAYGTPTKFKYIVTNRVRDGEAREGVLRTAALGPGNYTIKILASDYAGNAAMGKATELAITVE